MLRALCIAHLMMASNLSFAEEYYEDDLLLLYSGEETFNLSTGTTRPIRLAPSVASVITAQDIKKMGAVELNDVLKSVPGLNVSLSNMVNNPLFQIRGIHSRLNTHVLFLINSIPITSLYTGDRNIVWGGMPVRNISRVEVIRGPGSALYGADAFSGVINIVTKISDENEKLSSGVGSGSFNTKEAWLSHGSKQGELEVAFSLQVSKTDGYDTIIEQDGYGSSGSINTNKEMLDTRLELNQNNWKFRMGFQGRYDVGSGAGVGNHVENQSKSQSKRFNSDLTYHNPAFSSDNWDLNAQLSFYDTTHEAPEPYLLSPPPPVSGGLLGAPETFERHYRATINTLFHGVDKHTFNLGIGYRYGEIYKVNEGKNFEFNDPNDVSQGISFLPGGYTQVGDDEEFMPTKDRKNSFIFVQDEWRFLPDWIVTAGMRYDHYSDFGETFNPRIAVVWATSWNVTTKLLHGEAFRAPSMSELYNRLNPILLGNPELDPEKIRTTELVYIHNDILVDVNVAATLFYYKMKDMIEFQVDPSGLSSTAQNAGTQTGKGVELEVEWKSSTSFSASAHYAYQESRDKMSNSSTGMAPRHSLYVDLKYKFMDSFDISSQLLHVAKRERTEGDTRSEIDDYSTIDISAQYSPFTSPWKSSLAIHNILDEEVKMPSYFDPSGPYIVSDIPGMSRRVMVYLSYQLE